MKTRKLRTLTISSLLIVLSASLMSCVDSTDSGNSTPNTFEALQQSQGFSSITSLLQQTGLDSTLSTSHKYILLAPTDNAFSSSSANLLDNLSNEQLKDVLSYHLIDGDDLGLNSSVAEDSTKSLTGEYLYFTVAQAQGDTNKVNNKILYRGSGTSNGGIYPVSKVLLPDKYSSVKGLISKRFQLSELYAALKKADLRNTLGDNSQSYTVFAPSDKALQNATLPGGTTALQNALKYHVVPKKLTAADLSSTTDSIQTLNGDKISVSSQGGSIMINGQATITNSDIGGTNGVVHIIDGVLEDN